MPEAPELRASRDQLQRFVGLTVHSTTALARGRYGDAAPIGHVEHCDASRDDPPIVEAIETHGKLMWWRFHHRKSDRRTWMHVTYGMTGQWVFDNGLDDHIAFCIALDRGREREPVYFRDPRHFGTIKFIMDERSHARKLSSLAPCVFDSSDDFLKFERRTQANRLAKKKICEALLDQRALFAGVGNYLRAEILHAALIDPHRPVEILQQDELIALWYHTKRITVLSYEHRGATIATYAGVDGELGSFSSMMQVYGRKVDPLGNAVVREKDRNGRTIWWCPQVQR